MAIEHNTIGAGEIHEPKGITTAPSNQVYVSDGLGSGAWTNQIGGANTVNVNSIDDFPAAVSGVITLDDNIHYVLSADISTSNRFVLGSNNALYANSTFSPILTYTGTDSMFTGVDVNFFLKEIRLDCPSGKVFSLSDTAGNVYNVQMEDVIIQSAAAFGSFDDLQALVIDNCSCLNATQGLDFTGSSWSILSISRLALITTSASHVAIDLASAVFFNIEIGDLFVTSTTAGARGLSGLASNGNLLANSVGALSNSNFNANVTPLTNITKDDVRWNFSGNSGVANTDEHALAYLLNNATDTVISTVDTPVLIAGTFSEQTSSHYTTSAAGRITYVGERSSISANISVSITAAMASGGSKNITFYVAKNGTVVTNSGMSNDVTSSAKGSTALIWQEDLAPNDYLEMWAENNSDTVDITVEDMNFLVS